MRGIESIAGASGEKAGDRGRIARRCSVNCGPTSGGYFWCSCW